jgi:hypothetical protein
MIIFKQSLKIGQLARESQVSTMRILIVANATTGANDWVGKHSQKFTMADRLEIHLKSGTAASFFEKP